MAVSKQPTITPETSSGEGLDEEPTSRGEAKWKRFHPFRVVRKIFRRRIKREGTNVVSDASKKSWSTSELQCVQDDNAGKCEVTSPLKIGLSVSHDSIFSPENNTNIVSNETLNVPHGSSLSIRHTSMKNMFKDELFIRIRARRDSDDDGIGMQNSPYSSPTTVDILSQGFKEKLPKSQTTCSAGSLISMGSSENDEDSNGQSSGHSSRMSLIDRRSLDSEADSEVANPVPLNHTAAHHKIAIRPKRTYGLPRRRMKQVAASKVISLPSTPEVTEDMSKCLQQLEVTEIVRSTSEVSTLTGAEIISTSVSLTERHMSFNSATSYSETSHFTSEIQEVKEKYLNEISPQMKADFEDGLKWSDTDYDIKQETAAFVADMHTSVQSKNSVEEKLAERTQKSIPDIFSYCKQSLVGKIVENEMESYKLIQNTLQDKSKCDMIHDENPSISSAEAQVSVSSFVKSIEKSDSFKGNDKCKKPPDEIKSNFEKIFEHSNSNQENKERKSFEEIELKYEESKACSLQKNTPEEFSDSLSFNATQDFKRVQQNCINEVFNKNPVQEKLDIDSEFVLKPLKKDRKLSGESDSSYKDSVTEKQKDNSIVSSVYLEEESIMSNKSLSTGMEESRIFVSHHTSFSDDLKDILVTEAHNYAAVDKTSEKSIHNIEDAVTNNDREICEPYISSVGISSSSTKEGAFYSSSSALSDKRISEDKITISVNSKSENVKSHLISPKIENAVSQPTFQNNPTPESTNNQKVTEKQLKPIYKSHLPDISPNMVSVKNTNSQKRVSVEIVPFSQRMKERKYQPITFANKECSTENKKNSSALVERKLSDRKIPKNKDLDKSSNRHSFSGVLSTEVLKNKKEGELASKKDVKKEKVQYPVQIRIHKSGSKPEIKDKNAISPNTEIKTSSKDKSDIQYMHTTKVAESEIKHLREENKAQESTPKWEIKIQPAVSQANALSTLGNDENNSSMLSQKNFIHKTESFKSTQLTGNENKDTDFESAMIKSQENNWKSSKDSSVLSDDPEPELLRVFARRSIKQKHCDKGKADELEIQSDSAPEESSNVDISERNKEMISISLNSTVIKISENSKPHITKPDLKKKSKSFCEKEKVPRSVSPLKEMNLIQRDSSVDSSVSNENVHSRQRLANIDDTTLPVPSENEKKTANRNESMVENSLMIISKEEQLYKSTSVTAPPSTSVNGSFSNLGMVKENQDMIPGKEAHTPAWLQLAQQRREMREQRERLLLGGSPNSFMDGSNKPTRSSKVWDMVNNFQKLQMT